MKGIVAAIIFFIFGVVVGIVALTTPVYRASQGSYNYRALPFARFCVTYEGCASFSDAGLTSAQSATFIAYSVIVLLYLVIAVIGIIAGVLERCRRVRKLHLMVIFAVDGVFAFVAWVMMASNFAASPASSSSATWGDLNYTLGPSTGIMIVGWVGCIAGFVLAFFVKGREDEGYAPNDAQMYAPLNAPQYAPAQYNGGAPMMGAPMSQPHAPRSGGDTDVSTAPPGYVWTTTTTTVTTTVTRQLTPLPPPVTAPATETAEAESP